ncbi:PAS domain-containing sensor histidine kinase [Bacillus sp. DJP31]|uniref:PAS domain-containing sensor histidine kinase n=1 Tax=Bacillus sp. DJP31 TaxID=3409789 RepID=UPI003BB521C3
MNKKHPKYYQNEGSSSEPEINEEDIFSKVQEELQSSIEELSDLKFALDESAIVAITNAKGIISYVNDKFCKISKYDRDELLGKTHKLINSDFHSKDFFRDLWETIRVGRVWKGEIKNKAKNGSFYWVDTTIVPFLDKEGKPYQFLAIRYEVTDRKIVEEELKNMMTKMIGLQEQERKRISSELHDGVGQNLYSLLISISRLKNELDHPLLDQMHDETTNLIEDIRNISWELRPSVLDDLGLVPAIRTFIHRFSTHFDIRIEFNCSLKRRLTYEMETSIYRILQEGLTNMRKYAGVDIAYVTITELNNQVEVEIKDYGYGFDTKKRRGIGLFSMEERAKSIGAEIKISSDQNIGTTILLKIPTA